MDMAKYIGFLYLSNVHPDVINPDHLVTVLMLTFTFF